MTAVFKMGTSKIFCLHCTSLRQEITGTAGIQYPYGFPSDRRKTVAKAVQFRRFRTFRRTPKRGEQGAVCQRSAPTGTRRNFVEGSILPLIQNCCAPLTDNAALPPSPSRKVRKCPGQVTKYAVCFGFGDLSCGFVGVYSRQLLLKNAGECGRM